MCDKRAKGFTLIELLVTLAIIAILAAIGITSYLSALHRARQKRTVADIRTIATAWDSRAAEALSYTAAGFTFPTLDVPYGNLNQMLVPTYTRVLPRNDGWNRPLQFAVGETITNAQTYAIRSAGRDGDYEGSTYNGGSTTNLDCDIVFSAGTFIQYPEVMQSQ
ncbi:MAG TPA: prepilin-type N-terminal cleavage/methylation domain-containing protein [Thermoanaerobaculia bacterium]|nr:prepilin-type N-terminal cleavage/methylation domain-containing protein [Thermoanaerobaculia bacterium]